MKIQRNLLLSSLLCLGLLVIAGCGGGPSKPTTYPVTGTVTYKGTPLEGATVTFISKNQVVQPHSAVGTTNAAGKFELTTFANGDGAVAGSYLVKVVKFEYPKPKDTAPATNPINDGVEIAIEEDSGYNPDAGIEAVDPLPQNVLPNKFEDPNKSGLTAEVKAGENPPMDFNLE